MYLLRKTVIYSFAFEIKRHNNNYFLNINGSRITNSSIFQSSLLWLTSLNVTKNASEITAASHLMFIVVPAKRLCELNNKAGKMKPDNLIKKKGSSSYGPVKVIFTL